MIDIIQNKYLCIFPKDKSYLSYERLDEITGFDYGELVETFGELRKLGFIEGALPSKGFGITDEGLKWIKQYRRKEYMDANAYWRAKYWWLIAIVSAALGWILKIIEMRL
jgi:hypothetical protein